MVLKPQLQDLLRKQFFPQRSVTSSRTQNLLLAVLYIDKTKMFLSDGIVIIQMNSSVDMKQLFCKDMKSIIGLEDLAGSVCLFEDCHIDAFIEQTIERLPSSKLFKSSRKKSGYKSNSGSFQENNCPGIQVQTGFSNLGQASESTNPNPKKIIIDLATEPRVSKKRGGRIKKISRLLSRAKKENTEMVSETSPWWTRSVMTRKQKKNKRFAEMNRKRSSTCDSEVNSLEISPNSETNLLLSFSKFSMICPYAHYFLTGETQMLVDTLTPEKKQKIERKFKLERHIEKMQDSSNTELVPVLDIQDILGDIITEEKGLESEDSEILEKGTRTSTPESEKVVFQESGAKKNNHNTNQIDMGKQ